MILAAVTVQCPSNGRRASSTFGLLPPAAQSSAGRAACSCLPWPAVLPRRPHRPHTTPTAGQAIPQLTHTPCSSAVAAASHRSRTSEPSYSTPRGHPLPHVPQLCIVPFLGLAVVHRLGALGAAWSMSSTTDFLRKSTIRGEADSWVHDRSKEAPPYYAENNDSSTWQQGPTGRAIIFHEKNVSPLTAGTYQRHLRTQGSASKKMIRPLTAGTHQLHLRTQGSA